MRHNEVIIGYKIVFVDWKHEIEVSLREGTNLKFFPIREVPAVWRSL